MKDTMWQRAQSSSFGSYLPWLALPLVAAVAVDGWYNRAPDLPQVSGGEAAAGVSAEVPACQGGETAARSIQSPATWVTTDDYPASAIRRSEQGTTALAFTVSPAGAVQDCRVTSSSGSAVLDATACRLVTERGRYTVQRDARGCPTATAKTLRFAWRLPDA